MRRSFSARGRSGAHRPIPWLAIGALLALGACSVPPPAPSLGGGRGALGGLDGAAMTDQSAGSGASINDALSPGGGGTSVGPGGIYPPLQ